MEWKLIKEETPPKDKLILISDGYLVGVGELVNGKWKGVCPFMEERNISHWHVLPPRPYIWHMKNERPAVGRHPIQTVGDYEEAPNHQITCLNPIFGDWMWEMTKQWRYVDEDE